MGQKTIRFDESTDLVFLRHATLPFHANGMRLVAFDDEGGDGTHHVSLDKVIKTMRETGADMKVKYKETARRGLTVNMVEC